MIVDDCLTSCYNDLPQPEVVLSPEDTELNYFLWMPGFKYQPTLKEKLSTLRSSSLTSDSTIEEVLEDLIEIDELECKFNSKAQNGHVNLVDAATMAREMGAVPSQGDLLEFMATYGNELTLDQFKELCAISLYNNEDKDYLRDVFNSFNDVCLLLNATIFYPTSEVQSTYTST